MPLVIVFERDFHSGVPDAVDATKTQTAIPSSKLPATTAKLVIPFVQWAVREVGYPICELT